MNFFDALNLSLRMFKNRPLRTLLTILGVGVGIGTVLFLVSFGYGIQRAILSRITTADSLLSLDVNPGVSGLVEINKENISSMATIPGVVETSRMANIYSQINFNGNSSDGLSYIIDPSFFRLGGIKVSIGQEFSETEEDSAVISTAVASLFNVLPEEIIDQEIGLTFYINKVDENGNEDIQAIQASRKYRVVGVVDDENTSYVFVPFDDITESQINKFDQLKVKVSSVEEMGAVRDGIIEKGFLVSSLSDTIDQANKIFGVIQIILSLFGLVALLVSAIGMFNTMTIALLERTNEIGIMRSIGITGKDIRKIFLLESGIMGLMGGLGGIIIGFIGGLSVNLAINMLARNFGGKALNLFYTPWEFIFFIVVFSIIVGVLTGIYPSFRASKLNPLDALRYK
ncbi:MAG: ABC transporter permease [Patescibacteria group bacterium]